MSETNPPAIAGIHHVTAICGSPQKNVDFYSGVLGLRLVKKTVNFDDPGSYHLYYGDGIGSPGTIMTFFAWTNIPPIVSARGTQGTGEIAVASFSISEASLGYWIERLSRAAVAFDGPTSRFDEQVLSLRDPDGLPIELVAHPGGGARHPWAEGPVPVEHAIRGFRGATSHLLADQRTAALLTETMGFREIGSEGARRRFQIGDGVDIAMLDLIVHPDGRRGAVGIGVIHHIAWRTRSIEEQLRWKHVLEDAGRFVTEVLDRQYFESIYFREPGGVLFEIATDPPGFTVDEPYEQLGSALKLPSWLEPEREKIEARLPQVVNRVRV